MTAARGGELGRASSAAADRTLQSERMRKGAPHTYSFAFTALLVLLTGCTSPAAMPGASTGKQTAAAVPTVEPTLAPDAPCKECWPLSGKPLKLGSADKRALLVKI